MWQEAKPMHHKQQFRNLLSPTMSNATAVVLAIVVVLALVSVLTESVSAQTYSVLYRFTGGMDGSGPFAGVIRDVAGNLYGTAFGAGAHGYGTVFKLSRKN